MFVTNVLKWMANKWLKCFKKVKLFNLKVMKGK